VTAAVAGTVARGAATRAGAGAAAKSGASRTAATRAGGRAAATSSSTAAQQRDAIQAIKDARPAEPPAAPPATSTGSTGSTGSGSSGRRELPGVLTDQRGAPQAFRIDGLRAANTGGGFVLGAFVYVIGLTYLRGGKPAVQRWFKAKFFNEVGA
jgi:hypothetical protein